MTDALSALEARLNEDLERLVFTGKDWIPPRVVNDKRVRDVVIIGAGQCGLVASVALQHYGIHNHVLYDMAPQGQEGPWITIARMETLRSPKQLAGPAYGLPSLTFRAWFEATYGVDAWRHLDKITRDDWMNYLIWYRKVMKVPVVNNARMTGMAQGSDGLIALQMDIDGDHQTVLTRKLVLATGRDGFGGNFLPQIAFNLPQSLRAHSADEINFNALRGKTVGVIGAGASAMDNAATALEHGAGRVDLFIRRPDIPRVNKGMGVSSPGLTFGYQALPDEWKWRIQEHLAHSQTPPPHQSTLRVSRHENAYFHLSSPITALAEENGRVHLTTPKGTYLLDFLIFATGFCVDFGKRPELAAIADDVALWRDTKVSGARAKDSLATSPVLGEHFELTEKVPGRCPMLSSIYGFNFPATLSHGKLTGDIPAISAGADRLAQGLVRRFFVEDIDAHWHTLETYNTPELTGDEWHDADT